MRSFSVEEFGDAENPEIVLNFFVYTTFARGLWKWVGENAGEEVWARFEQIETEKSAAEEDALALTGESEEEETDDEEVESEVGS